MKEDSVTVLMCQTLRRYHLQDKLHHGAAMTTEVTWLSIVSFSSVLKLDPYRFFFSLNVVVGVHKLRLMVVESLSMEN